MLWQFLLYAVIGLAAQLIDGTMGMAYGISCRTFLRSVAGLPASMASAVVHCSEIPSTLVSGIAHWRFKNLDKKLFLKVGITGALGGVAGAWLLSSIGDTLEPFIDVYLVVMGVIILTKAFRKKRERKDIGELIYPLGLAGGFLDAVGGGGWGPVVTSTLLAADHEPKKTIGTVNAAEFLVTVAQTTTFLTLAVDLTRYGIIILGLVVGGVIGSFVAAWLCKKIPVRPLLVLVGALIVGLNIYNLVIWGMGFFS